VGQAEARLKEAAKLGLTQAVIASGGEMTPPKGMRLKPVETVADLTAWIASL
jgi:predicted ATP-dependent serine protease